MLDDVCAVIGFWTFALKQRRFPFCVAKVFSGPALLLSCHTSNQHFISGSEGGAIKYLSDDRRARRDCGELNSVGWRADVMCIEQSDRQ